MITVEGEFLSFDLMLLLWGDSFLVFVWFYWRRAAFQCFCRTVKWTSHTHMYFRFLLEFLLIQVTTVHEIEEVPVLHRMFSSVIRSIHSVNSVYVSTAAFLFLPLPLSSLVPTFVLCALQIRSSIPFFWTPHYTIMCDICFPPCVTLGMAVSRSIHVCTSDPRGSKIHIWFDFVLQCVCTKYRYKWMKMN